MTTLAPNAGVPMSALDAREAPTYLPLTRLKSLLQEAKDYHSQYSKKWDENLAIYRGIDKNQKSTVDYEGYPNIRIKYAFQTLEVIRVNVVEPQPTFDFIPLSSAKASACDMLDTLIPYQLRRDNFTLKQNIWVEDDFVCGVNIAKVTWKRHQVQRAGGRVDLFNQPTADPIDPRCFYPDPNAPFASEWRYVFQEGRMSKEELEYMVDQGVYSRSAVRDMLRYSNTGSGMDDKDKGYKVWEFWTHDTVQTFSDKAILANRPNEHYGGIPFDIGSTIPRSRCVFGVPEVDLVGDPQELLWVLDSMGLEALKYAARPVVGYRRDRVGAAELSANMRPGGAIPFQTPNDLALFFSGGGAEQIFQRKAEALADVQNVTGASSYLAGADSKQYGVNQSTATGISILEASASKRMRHRMMNLEQFYNNIVRKFIKLDADFLPDQTQLAIRRGREFKRLNVRRQEIAGDFEAIPVWLSQSTNEEAQLQSLQALFNTLLPLAMQGYVFPNGEQINLQPMIEEMAALRRKDPRQYFTTPKAAPAAPMMGAPLGMPSPAMAA